MGTVKFLVITVKAHNVLMAYEVQKSLSKWIALRVAVNLSIVILIAYLCESEVIVRILVYLEWKRI